MGIARIPAAILLAQVVCVGRVGLGFGQETEEVERADVVLRGVVCDEIAGKPLAPVPAPRCGRRRKPGALPIALRHSGHEDQLLLRVLVGVRRDIVDERLLPRVQGGGIFQFGQSDEAALEHQDVGLAGPRDVAQQIAVLAVAVAVGKQGCNRGGNGTPRGISYASSCH